MVSQFNWRSGVALLLSCGLVGCLSFSLEFGGRRPPHPAADSILCQSGNVTLQPGELRTVYYPVAYHSPPNLEVSSNSFFKRVELLNQQRDHFCVRASDPGGFPIEVSWSAKGLPVTVALPAPPVLVVPSPDGPPTVPPPPVAPVVPRPVLPPLAP